MEPSERDVERARKVVGAQGFSVCVGIEPTMLRPPPDGIYLPGRFEDPIIAALAEARAEEREMCIAKIDPGVLLIYTGPGGFDPEGIQRKCQAAIRSRGDGRESAGPGGGETSAPQPTGRSVGPGLLPHQSGAPSSASSKPTVVTLCGSTRFKDQFVRAMADETDAGKIVLTCGRFVPQSELVLGPERKAALDELHKRKIDLSDEILVLNVDGYVGSSTRSEIEYAKATGKRVRWLEPSASPAGESQS